VLAQAPAGGGFGTSVLGANLTLAIPATATAGPYTSTLTLTAVTALPTLRTGRGRRQQPATHLWLGVIPQPNAV